MKGAKKNIWLMFRPVEGSLILSSWEILGPAFFWLFADSDDMRAVSAPLRHFLEETFGMTEITSPRTSGPGEAR